MSAVAVDALHPLCHYFEYLPGPILYFFFNFVMWSQGAIAIVSNAYRVDVWTLDSVTGRMENGHA